MGGERLGGLAVYVRDGHDLGLRQAEGQCFGMHAADAACAYDSDMKSHFAQCTLTGNSRTRLVAERVFHEHPAADPA